MGLSVTPRVVVLLLVGDDGLDSGSRLAGCGSSSRGSLESPGRVLLLLLLLVVVLVVAVIEVVDWNRDEKWPFLVAPHE
jgi:hypothetical protein